jgi:hypothetical protein
MRKFIADLLIRHLTKEVERPPQVSGLGYHWADFIRPGDVILVEGTTRISTAIKYLTQSTWSHAAMVTSASPPEIIEADVKNGVVKTGIDKYMKQNVRICRPIDLTPEEINEVIQHAESHIGVSYDIKNLVDLARYLLPTPPVPARFRRQMLTLGSGDPTEKLICSSLIARSFQHIRYPILPIQWWTEDRTVISQVRHYSLFMPRDFDLSPYFSVVKPTVEGGFDHKTMQWAE